MGDSDLDDDIENFGRFGGLATEEGPAHGGVEKEVFDKEGCPTTCSAGLLFDDVPPTEDDPVTFAFFRGTSDGHFGHRGDGSDCFSAKSVRL